MYLFLYLIKLLNSSKLTSRITAGDLKYHFYPICPSKSDFLFVIEIDLSVPQ